MGERRKEQCKSERMICKPHKALSGTFTHSDGAWSDLSRAISTIVHTCKRLFCILRSEMNRLYRAYNLEYNDKGKREVQDEETLTELAFQTVK